MITEIHINTKTENGNTIYIVNFALNGEMFQGHTGYKEDIAREIDNDICMIVKRLERNEEGKAAELVSRIRDVFQLKSIVKSLA